MPHCVNSFFTHLHKKITGFHINQQFRNFIELQSDGKSGIFEKNTTVQAHKVSKTILFQQFKRKILTKGEQIA
jgi:hypothetical protein